MAFSSNMSLITPMMRALIANGSRSLARPTTIASYQSTANLSTVANNQQKQQSSSSLALALPATTTGLLGQRILTSSLHTSSVNRDIDSAAAAKLTPLFDRVLVKRDENQTQTKGGIMLPEQAQSKTQTATVIAVGAGYRNKNGDYIKPVVKTGDKVLLPEYGGNKIQLDGEDHHIFRESDIIGKWN